MSRSGPKAGGTLRWTILLAVTVLVLAAAGVYAVAAYNRFQDSRTAASGVEIVPGGPSLPNEPFVLFRNTAAGQGYGLAATVPISAPKGGRSIGGAACDRVYGTAERVMCLRTIRGLVTGFEAATYDGTWKETGSWSLPGIPSRTRIADDGSVAASTVFVSGHSYAAAGFSTETVIRPLDGKTGTGNLEDFALVVNGERITAADRNIWGVTFLPHQTEAFYATAASSGRIWLVKGSISSRTLTAVHDGVECPSVSPDGTLLAFKKNQAGLLTPHWNLAILDLSNGKETVLAETRSVDDQVEWLDGQTLLYGLSRAGEPGDSDVWQINADPGSRPSVFIEHAWSPSVVR